MKKIMLFVIIALAFAGCGSSGDGGEKSKSLTVEFLRAGGDVNFSDPYNDYDYTLRLPENAVAEDVAVTIKFYDGVKNAPMSDTGDIIYSVFEIIKDGFKFDLDVPYAASSNSEVKAGIVICRYTENETEISLFCSETGITAEPSNQGLYILTPVGV